MKFIKKLRSSFAFNIIGFVVALMLLFGVVVSTIGYFNFTASFLREYTVTTYHMADTATALVNGDHIDDYLKEGGTGEEFAQTAKYLDSYCKKMNVTVVYVIKVDTSDYGRFVSVFNSVSDDSPYTPWEIGYRRDTTNEEYVKTYRDLYEGKIPYGTLFRTTDLNGAPPHITTIVPVKNSQGEVVSLMCIQRPMEELVSGRRPYLINIALSTVAAALVISVFVALYIRREFVRPISKVIDESKRFAAENTKGEKLGDHFSKIEEISALAGSIDRMEEDMMRYIDNLTAVTAEKGRIGTELALAGAIQMNSIPTIFPAFPDRKDFDIYASMTPAKTVGGDFYNFFLIDDNRLAIAIGDVSGKGVPASLFMMVTNILISEHTHVGGTPADILALVNQRLCENNKAEMFVTVWLGILNLSDGSLTAANAGHENPAIMRRDGDFELVKTRHGLVLGAMEGVRYQNIEIRLNRGDKLFLYTDGVPEATDQDDGMYGTDRMIRTLNRHKSESPQEIIGHVSDSVNEFVGSAPQFDDLTMVCVELRQEEAFEMTVDAVEENLQAVNDFVHDRLKDQDCSVKTLMQIDLAVEEIFVNIAKYAYSGQGGKAEIAVEIKGDAVVLTFKDSGVPYDPLAKPDPDVGLSAEERQVGGLGIFLVKKNMDRVTYDYRNGMNVLSMEKRLR